LSVVGFYTKNLLPQNCFSDKVNDNQAVVLIYYKLYIGEAVIQRLHSHAVYIDAFYTNSFDLDDLMFSSAHGKFDVIQNYLVYENFAARNAVGIKELIIVCLQLTFYSSHGHKFSVVTRLRKGNLEQY
jgi:hypothetical protein